MSDDDLKFKLRFSCIVSGPSGSGKTSFCLRLLQKIDALCTERDFGGCIIWCYSEKTAVPSRQLLPSNATYHECEPENFGSDCGGKPCLVILDDLLNDVYSKHVCDRNISVILIRQNLFHQGRYCRDVLLNIHYLVALKNV